MRPIALLTLLLALCTVFIPSAEGEVPRRFTYQAVVTDDDGVPISNGLHDFRFRLYPLANAVWPVWEETQSLTTVNGLFHATLGEVVSFDTVFPGGVATFDRQYWLAVAIDGGEDVIRLPLESAPYAFIAGAMDDSSVTAPMIANSALVRSINGLQDDLLLQGANGVNVSNIGNTITITGGGGGGAGNWALTGNAITNTNSGFVGINRSTPASPAEYFGIHAPVSTGYGGMYISTDGGEGQPFYGYSVPGGSAWTYYDGADNSWNVYNGGLQLTVSNGGLVGIGHSAPTERLQVGGVIHSTTGGFRFPDGSLQITADVGGGGGADSDWLVVGNDMFSLPSDQIFIGTSDPSLNSKLTIEDEVRGSTIVTIRDDLFTELKVNGGTATSNLQVGFNQARLISGAGDDLRLTASETLWLESVGVTDWFAGGGRRAQMDTGGLFTLYNPSGVGTIELDPDVTGGGQLALENSAGTRTVKLFGNKTNGSEFELSNSNGVMVAELLGGTSSTNRDGFLQLRNSSGTQTLLMRGQNSSGSAYGGGYLALKSENAITTFTLEAQEDASATQGAAMKFYNDAGVQTVEIDADYGGSNEGRVITDVLEITGGSDLSENFDVTAAGADLEPGSVVCIDPHNPGRLVVARSPYDRTVAGVVSGAGGVRPGMLMGQRGSEADGKHPVALTGRVYVRCDASDGPIEPGDMLTTSGTPGHAQVVGDFARAQGAILGKAMTSLDSGRGLVLVLVSLQ